jgi:hypothetical protein
VTLVWAPPDARAQFTDITVCNKGSVDVLVASLKVFDTFSSAKAWQSIEPGMCESVHWVSVTTGFSHLNESARVNLAFATQSGGVVRPFLRSYGYEPDGTENRPRLLCLPPRISSGWTVDSSSGSDYLPPCRTGVLPVPVSFSAYIQGQFHLTIDVTPPVPRENRP